MKDDNELLRSIAIVGEWNEQEKQIWSIHYDNRYAIVRIGGRAVVYEKKTDEQMFSLDAQFYHSNDKMHIKTLSKDGTINDTSKPAFPFWLEHTSERYDRITFNPSKEPGKLNNEWNTWKGWPIEPNPSGTCDTYLEHIYENICNNNKEHYEYILDWMSQIIQKPTEKTFHALSIKGDQGSGKSIFVQIFMKLFGDAAVEINDSEQLTQQFNSILANRLLVYGDEAFWSGDKKNRGKLKNLISSSTMGITYKRKDTITMPNYMRFIFTTNNDWAAPVENGERRWVTFRCGNKHREDKPYFQKMIKEMNNGGYGKLMEILLKRDISKRDWTDAPVTEAMKEDKAYTEVYDNPLFNYFQDCLNGMKENNFFDMYDHGETIEQDGRGVGVPVGRFKEYISKWAKDNGQKLNINNTNLGTWVNKIFREDIPRDTLGRPSIMAKKEGKSVRVYYFGTRDEIQSIVEDYEEVKNI